MVKVIMALARIILQIDEQNRAAVKTPVNVGVRTNITGALQLWRSEVIIADGYTPLIPVVFKPIAMLCAPKHCLQSNQSFTENCERVYFAYTLNLRSPHNSIYFIYVN